MFEKGKLMPDLDLAGADGQSARLWDFRNKTHIAFFVTEDGSFESVKAKMAEAAAHKKTWDWLGVKLFGVKEKGSLEAGAYAVDRYGGFIGHHPYTDDLWKKLEDDFLYYEAKHC